MPPTRVEKMQRMLRNFTWMFRYAALACLFASVYLLLLRPVKRQVLAAFRELPKRLSAGAGQITGAGVTDGTADLESILGKPLGEGDVTFKKVSALKKHLVEKVKSEPAGATRLIQNWLHEGGVD